MNILRISTLSILCLFAFFISPTYGQIEDPIQWEVEIYESAIEGKAELVFQASLEAGWHVYSQNLDNLEGPLPTYFEMQLPEGVTRDSIVNECEPHVEYDPNFMMDLKFFEGEVYFWTTLNLANSSDTDSLSGMLNYMVCNATMCLPPTDIYYDLSLSDLKPLADLPVFCSEVEDSGPGILEPVIWDINLYETEEEGFVDLVFHADVEEHWHVYSQNLESLDGPMPTYFSIDLPANATRDSIVHECTPKEDFDPNFNMNVKFFEGQIYFWSTIDLSEIIDIDSITGMFSYMTCDDSMCIFPPDEYFELSVNDVLSADLKPEFCNETIGGAEEEEEELFWIFMMGFVLGFAALFTPCVFPMIPMTVSFFTKTSKTRAQGIKNALIYGFFIIFIYTALGLALTAVFGVDIMNVISTDPYFNIGLFALLVIFGASFLGFFEIQLPQNWANKADAASDRGGLIGIFFMAATLAIVSFSCTGPLIGGALAGAATGSFAAPTAVMLGFSIALALPFMFFSAFPGYLNSLPSSGGWLNTVKVVLGFIEIGFAFKFLSNADMVLQLGLLPREIFIGIWIIVSLLTALYLYGVIRMPHDTPGSTPSFGRKTLATVFLAFSYYMVPGLTGSPLNLISGFPPPASYSIWTVTGDHHVEARFSDYDEGMAAAIAEGKPMLLDFTGWACVNCRKMEEQVWPDPEVSRIIHDEVVLVSLYVDDRTKLPEEEWSVEEYGGKEFRIQTIGKKWSYMQARDYDRNAQPYYVLVDHDGNQVGGSAGYNSNPEVFLEYLNDALEKFEKRK